MMSASPSMMMSANAPTMAMNGTPAARRARSRRPRSSRPAAAHDERQRSHDGDEHDPAGKKDAEPQSSVVTAGGGAMMSANAPTMAMNANPAAMMKARRRAAKLPVEGSLPSLAGAVEWLNSPPLTAEALKGKVVLVDFWTYSCINCLRAIPYVRAWAEKYKDQGLVVIGVHAPEFAFEKNVDNVKKAVADSEDRLSSRDRQRLCDLARVQ